MFWRNCEKGQIHFCISFFPTMSVGRSLADVLGRRAAVQAVASSIAGPSRRRFSSHALAAPRLRSTHTSLRSPTRRRPLSPYPGANFRRERRGIATEATSAAASASIFDPLVSALLASPLPSYGLTIIALTLAVRTCVTLPATLWQRKRLDRSRDLVVPEMKRINAVLAPQMARESRKQGLDYEAYKKALKARVGCSSCQVPVTVLWLLRHEDGAWSHAYDSSRNTNQRCIESTRPTLYRLWCSPSLSTSPCSSPFL